jgi:hypothetical protein
MTRRHKRPRPDPNPTASIILDTNVVCEIFAFGDLIRERARLPSDEDALRDPGFTSRQLRSRYSNVLAWHFAKNRIVTASLIDEAIATLLRVAPHTDPRVAALTSAIVHVIKPGCSVDGATKGSPTSRRTFGGTQRTRRSWTSQAHTAIRWSRTRG